MEYTDEMRRIQREHESSRRDFGVDEIIEMIGGLSRVNRMRLFKKIKKGKWRTADNSGVELEGNKHHARRRIP